MVRRKSAKRKQPKHSHAKRHHLHKKRRHSFFWFVPFFMIMLSAAIYRSPLVVAERKMIAFYLLGLTVVWLIFSIYFSMKPHKFDRHFSHVKERHGS